MTRIYKLLLTNNTLRKILPNEILAILNDDSLCQSLYVKGFEAAAVHELNPAAMKNFANYSLKIQL